MLSSRHLCVVSECTLIFLVTLLTKQRVATEEAQRFARAAGALYVETSAKARDGLAGIQKMFADLARALPESATRPAVPKDEIPDLRAKPTKSGGGCPC